MSSSIELLNEGQRECLRLVMTHMTSKEISRKLNISSHTVDQRLRDAMRIMGAGSRFEAARKFFEDTEGRPYQPLIYQSPDVEYPFETGSLEVSVEQKVDYEEGGEQNTKGKSSFGKIPLPFPRHYGEKNLLPIPWRLGWIAVIALGSAFLFGGILSGLDALSRLAN